MPSAIKFQGIIICFLRADLMQKIITSCWWVGAKTERSFKQKYVTPSAEDDEKHASNCAWTLINRGKGQTS